MLDRTGVGAPAPPPGPGVPSGVDVWGVAADLSTAAIALVALVVAIFAARATIQTNRAQQRTLDLQRRQFEAAEARAEREQASKVLFTLSGGHVSEPSAPDGSGSVEVRVRGADTVELFNASDAPVFLVLLVQTWPQELIFFELGMLLPTGPEPESHSTGRAAHWPVPMLSLYFTDSAGVTWIRRPDGALQKASEDEVTATMELLIAHHERGTPPTRWVPAPPDDPDAGPGRPGSPTGGAPGA